MSAAVSSRLVVSQARRFRERRAKLARHLMSGDVVEDHFYLGTWLSGDGRRLRRAILDGKTGCGTTACIAGHAPMVFPRSWQWVSDRDGGPPVERRGGDGSVTSEFADFFGVHVFVAEELLLPGGTAWIGRRRVTARLAGETLLRLNESPPPRWAIKAARRYLWDA